MVHVNFALDHVSDGRGSLCARVMCDGRRLKFGMGYKIDVKKWSQSGQCCKNATIHNNITASEINQAIKDFRDKVEVTGRKLRDRGLPFDEFRNVFNENDSSSLLADELEAWAKDTSVLRSWSYNTTRRFISMAKRLRLSGIGTIADITRYNVSKWQKTMLADGLSNATIYKHIEMLRWYLNDMVRRGRVPSSILDECRCELKQIHGEVIYLTWEELQKLYNADFPDGMPWLDVYRDVFCFCAFSGLRYSDVTKLRKADIYDGAIHFTTEKTNDKLVVELNTYTTNILSKYAGNGLKTALPTTTNQRYNRNIKECCRHCGIDANVRMVQMKGNEVVEDIVPKWQAVTTHTARRTFVVNALSLGIPAEVVMKWTGHKSYEEMKPYIEIVEELRKTEMSKFDTKKADTMQK